VRKSYEYYWYRKQKVTEANERVNNLAKKKSWYVVGFFFCIIATVFHLKFRVNYNRIAASDGTYAVVPFMEWYGGMVVWWWLWLEYQISAGVSDRTAIFYLNLSESNCFHVEELWTHCKLTSESGQIGLVHGWEENDQIICEVGVWRIMLHECNLLDYLLYWNTVVWVPSNASWLLLYQTISQWTESGKL
jgi:hypothetical protein